MPEGPEIRRIADKLAKVLEEQHINRVEFTQPWLRASGEALAGRRICQVESRGKALLTHFDHGMTIYSHNQLYGVWKVVKGDTVPTTRRTLRLALHTDSHRALLYSASDISVWATADLGLHPFLARIGPDLLDASLHWRDISRRLSERPFAKRALSSLYLDQGFLAGLGNYLRTEILFDAGLPPEVRPTDLSRAQLGRLARSTLEISRRSYETGGVTLTPALRRRLSSASRPMPVKSGRRQRFAAFARAGEACYRCDNAIERTTCNARRLYLCNHCQPPLARS